MSGGPGVEFRIEPGGALRGRLRVPGDKSVSHRFVMLAALAEGESVARGFLEGEDTIATVNALRAMGVSIAGPADARLHVRGVGLHGLRAPGAPLDMGNSGTAMRLLAGVLAGQRFPSTLVGDASLTRRPMRRVTEPLALMGAHVETSDAGTPPLRLPGQAGALRAIRYDSPVASAQVKSCVLLAGLYANGRTSVSEPGPSRDHTERMLAAFGASCGRDGHTAWVDGGARLGSVDVDVPADISSAAFFMVGACIAPGSDLVLEGVGVNPTRTGVIDVLRAMGADISLLDEREVGGEPVADLRVRASRLRGTTISGPVVPRAIDEFPALLLAAACAEGETLLSGAGELRVKESDRIAATASALQALGVAAEPLADGMRIAGGQRIAGGVVDSRGDHRIAMAFAMAGLVAERAVRVTDCANVATSFPGFARLAGGAGLRIGEGQA